MAARRKPSPLRSIPGNRYFSQPKCCKHCGMRNCESEPSLPPIPTAALPSPPKPSAAAAGDVCVHSALVCRSGFPDFPHIFPKNKRKISGMMLSWGQELQDPSMAKATPVPHPQGSGTPPGMRAPPPTASPAPFPSWGPTSLGRARSSPGRQGKFMELITRWTEIGKIAVIFLHGVQILVSPRSCPESLMDLWQQKILQWVFRSGFGIKSLLTGFE